MDTDLLPLEDRALLAEYCASDLRVTLPLPPAASLRGLTDRWTCAAEAGGLEGIRAAGAALLDLLAPFYEVEAPTLEVLGVRPTEVEEEVSAELHGDYDPERAHVRVWMRTAVRGQVVRPRTLLHTLLHELCHHLDVRALGFAESFHTRGFYLRTDALYHLALGTAPAARTALRWRLVLREDEAWWRFDPRSFRRRGLPDTSGFTADWERLERAFGGLR